MPDTRTTGSAQDRWNTNWPAQLLDLPIDPVPDQGDHDPERRHRLTLHPPYYQGPREDAA